MPFKEVTELSELSPMIKISPKFFTEPSFAKSNYWLNVLLLDEYLSKERDFKVKNWYAESVNFVNKQTPGHATHMDEIMAFAKKYNNL